MNPSGYIVQYIRSAWLVPAVLLVLGGVTVFAWLETRSSINELAAEDFLLETQIVEESINRRFDIYITALRSGRALFNASDEVERAEWKVFAESLQLTENFPGIQGYGYSEWVPASELAAHTARIQAEGFPDFAVKPPGDREVYTSIVYLEPFDKRNIQAFGYDMYSEETRRKAMSEARDTGVTQMSGRVTLVQEIDEDVQAGFLVYVPTYRNNAPVSTVAERQAALIGYVYSPFRARNFMEGVLGSRSLAIDFVIFDGADTAASEDTLMFSSGPTVESLTTGSYDFLEKRTTYFTNHPWTIYYVASAGSLVNETVAWLVLIIGGLITLATVLVLLWFASRYERAQQLANTQQAELADKRQENTQIKSDLEHTNKILAQQKFELQKKVDELERLNKVMVNRELKMIELKRQVGKSDQ